MFPGAALARAPASALPDSVAQLSPAQLIETATGLLIDVFVEGAWQRSGVRWTTEAERDAITEKFTKRLTELFVGDPEFAEWVCSLDDPRPALCALILRWTREPEAGVTFDEPVCVRCHLAGICPNTGFSHKEASEGNGAQLTRLVVDFLARPGVRMCFISSVAELIEQEIWVQVIAHNLVQRHHVRCLPETRRLA